MPAPTRYEYKVIPAPTRGEKVRGAKLTEDRFAHALGNLMNKMGREGWDYMRAETLPCEERTGFTKRSTSFQNMLVFRRPLDTGTEDREAMPAMILRAETAAGDPPQAAKEVHAEPVLQRDPAPARAEGPRLVSSRADEGGKAPVLGSAKGEHSAD